MAFATAEQEQRAQPLRAWTSAQLDAVRVSARRVLQDWSTTWSMDRTTGRVLIVEHEPQRRPSTEALQRALQNALFAPTTHSPSLGDGAAIARRVGTQVWDDWRARVLAWAGLDLVGDVERIKPFVKPQAWSGDVLLQLHWCGMDWPLCLPGEAVARLAPPCVVPEPPRVAQVNLGEALEEHVLEAHVTLAPVTLRLGDLATLAIGDVVTLPHTLDQPLHLTVQDGQTPLCSGWLGQRHGLKALELTPAQHAPSVFTSS